MQMEEVKKASEIAKEFINRANELEKSLSRESGYIWGCKESSAFRRQSMELTRQLSKMRQSK